MTKDIKKAFEMYAYRLSELNDIVHKPYRDSAEIRLQGMRELLMYMGYEDEVNRIDAENDRIFSSEK